MAGRIYDITKIYFSTKKTNGIFTNLLKRKCSLFRYNLFAHFCAHIIRMSNFTFNLCRILVCLMFNGDSYCSFIMTVTISNAFTILLSFHKHSGVNKLCKKHQLFNSCKEPIRYWLSLNWLIWIIGPLRIVIEYI